MTEPQTAADRRGGREDQPPDAEDLKKVPARRTRPRNSSAPSASISCSAWMSKGALLAVQICACRWHRHRTIGERLREQRLNERQPSAAEAERRGRHVESPHPIGVLAHERHRFLVYALEPLHP